MRGEADGIGRCEEARRGPGWHGADGRFARFPRRAGVSVAVTAVFAVALPVVTGTLGEAAAVPVDR